MPNPHGNPNIAEYGKATQFKEGEGGRPLGARNKLNKAFVEAFLADFAEGGVEAIARMRSEKPEQYVAIAARLQPAQFADEDGEPTNPPSVIALTASTRPLPTTDDDPDD